MFGVSTCGAVLKSFCNVTVYTNGQDVDGSPKRSGTTVLYESLACTILPIGSRRGVEQGRVMTRASHTGWFPTHTSAGVAVTFGDDSRVTLDGVTYRPVGGLVRDISSGSPYLRCDLEVKP